VTPREIFASNDGLLAPFCAAEGMCKAKGDRYRMMHDAGLARDYEAAEIAVRSALALVQAALLAEHRTLAEQRSFG
jgi:hypothetical protein